MPDEIQRPPDEFVDACKAVAAVVASGDVPTMREMAPAMTLAGYHMLTMALTYAALAVECERDRQQSEALRRIAA